MKFLNHSYKNNRGGYSRLYKISCEKCNDIVCLYQKDGPGNLRRMYIDRMFKPDVSIKTNNLLCTKGHLFGIKINYEKENREAYRIFVDAITKQIVNSKLF